MKKLLAKLIPKIIGWYINVKALFSRRAAARQAFLLFCSPRAGRVSSEQALFLDPAKYETVTTSKGREIQVYRWQGGGPRILLIHGWESNSYRWFRLIEDLQKKDYDIIAFDGPAHGYTDGRIFNVPTYASYLELISKRYSPSYHIGHSVGGLTCLFHYNRYRPEYLSKMVVLGAPSELSEIMKDYQAILGLSSRVMLALEELVKTEFGFSFSAFSGAAFAKAVTIPGLIIHDTYDEIAPVTASRAIHAQWPKSTYIETQGFGHSLYQDDVRKAILGFID